MFSKADFNRLKNNELYFSSSLVKGKNYLESKITSAEKQLFYLEKKQLFIKFLGISFIVILLLLVFIKRYRSKQKRYSKLLLLNSKLKKSQAKNLKGKHDIYALEQLQGIMLKRFLNLHSQIENLKLTVSHKEELYTLRSTAKNIIFELFQMKNNRDSIKK